MKTKRFFQGTMAIFALATMLTTSAAAANLDCGLNTGKPATGAPIQIGAVVGKTGPADFSGPAQAADAYFKCINANGGIHGRPIAYTIVDDGWHPEQAAQVAAKLVRDLKVVAMVGSSSFVECAANASLYDAENVVVIAGTGPVRECFHSKNIAPTTGGARVSAVVTAEYMHKTFGDKRFVFVMVVGPDNVWLRGGVEEWGKSKGIEIKEILIDPASLDATSIMLQAASFHPDDILIALPKELATPMFVAAEQQGLGPKFHWSALTPVYDVAIPKAIGPYWDGKLYVGAELRPVDQNAPDTQNWRAILDKYASPSLPRDTFAQGGYLAARIATEVLLKLDPAKIDRATVAKALRDVKGFRSDMWCDPWYFGPGSEHNAVHAGQVMVVTKNGWAPKGGCIEDEDPTLEGIRKMETEFHLTK